MVSVIWIIWVVTMGDLQPLPNSPMFTSEDLCFAALPQYARGTDGVTCWPQPQTQANGR
jgi:hypothetical protein